MAVPVTDVMETHSSRIGPRDSCLEVGKAERVVLVTSDAGARWGLNPMVWKEPSRHR